ncbi:hypothetical protein JCM14469_37980 [Desulfatiferula olefinivorans]
MQAADQFKAAEAGKIPRRKNQNRVLFGGKGQGLLAGPGGQNPDGAVVDDV